MGGREFPGSTSPKTLLPESKPRREVTLGTGDRSRAPTSPAAPSSTNQVRALEPHRHTHPPPGQTPVALESRELRVPDGTRPSLLLSFREKAAGTAGPRRPDSRCAGSPRGARTRARGVARTGWHAGTGPRHLHPDTPRRTENGTRGTGGAAFTTTRVGGCRSPPASRHCPLFPTRGTDTTHPSRNRKQHSVTTEVTPRAWSVGSGQFRRQLQVSGKGQRARWMMQE